MKQATVSTDHENEHHPHPDHVPEARRKEAGVTPDGAAWAPRPRVDNAMVKALARGPRWRRMLDEGFHATIEDVARANGLAPSYVSSILRLTLLALDVAESILDGRQPAGLALDNLLKGFQWSGSGNVGASAAVPSR